MAELFGVVSAAAGLLGFTIQVVQIVDQFGSDLKHAPEDVKGFTEEVRTLHLNLEAISKLAIDDDFVQAFGSRGSLLRSATDTSLLIENCSSQLEKFLKKFDNAGQQKNVLGRGFERFRNALRASDIENTVVTLDRCCKRLIDMLDIDQASLVVKTAVDVQNASAKSEKWHEEEENQRILESISILDYQSKHDDVLTKCCAGTSETILNIEDFVKWRDGGNGMLSCKNVSVFFTGFMLCAYSALIL